MDRLLVRRRRLRQDRGGAARGVQGGDGRQAGGRAGADDGAGAAALQHLQASGWRAFPVQGRGALALPHASASSATSLERLAEGAVDIVIGTHRLLQKDVSFKDLGLVIIDEEQRFGVAHKERLKQLRSEVDVLTLTATPIPRTLHMSLVGVRDMSTIETPPEDRLPIRTYRQPVRRRRGARGDPARARPRRPGLLRPQPRADDRASWRSSSRELVPEARIAVGHGQMAEDAARAGDARVRRRRVRRAGLHARSSSRAWTSRTSTRSSSTTRTASGWRSSTSFAAASGAAASRAYAYFLYTRDTALTEMAEKRLRTIFEATELGAGFRIAMKDLEIRGAGNLLGAEQHGHIAAVGLRPVHPPAGRGGGQPARAAYGRRRPARRARRHRPPGREPGHASAGAARRARRPSSRCRWRPICPPTTWPTRRSACGSTSAWRTSGAMPS